MALTVQQIAETLGAALEGDGAVEITGVAGLHEAAAGQVSFLSNPRYTPAVADTRASAVVVGESWKGDCPCALLRVADPDKAFAQLVALLAPPAITPVPGVHPTAVVADDVVLGDAVSIGAHCVLQPGVRVGDRTAIEPGCFLGHGTQVGADGHLYPNVSMREYTEIGDRCIIHNGTVIGSDGYGYIPEEKDGRLVVTKIPQVGRVVIGDDVEIGANVAIDRARFGVTRIGNSVKIDNLVHIAHNVEIGNQTGIVAQVGIAGSTRIGARTIIWGQAGVGGHVSVGSDVRVGGRAGITKDVPDGAHVSGFPAMPHRNAKRLHAHMMDLPRLRERVKALEARIQELEETGKG